MRAWISERLCFIGPICGVITFARKFNNLTVHRNRIIIFQTAYQNRAVKGTKVKRLA